MFRIVGGGQMQHPTSQVKMSGCSLIKRGTGVFTRRIIRKDGRARTGSLRCESGSKMSLTMSTGMYRIAAHSVSYYGRMIMRGIHVLLLLLLAGSVSAQITW
jgi:hypothetical protein